MTISKGISPKEVLQCFIKENEDKDVISKYESIITKLANVEKIVFVQNKQEGAASLMVRTTEIFIPVSQNINKEEEIKKIKHKV